MPSLRVLTFLSDIQYLKSRPNPTAPDGEYDSETSQNNDLKTTRRHSWLTNMVHRAQSIKAKGLPTVNARVIVSASC